MPPKKKKANDEGPKSSTERMKKSRQTVQEDSFERISTKRTLVVVDGKSDSDYSELVLKERFTSKGVEHNANTEHIDFFIARITSGPTLPLTNRDVFQVFGLTMPRITAIGEPDDNAPPVRDLETDEEGDQPTRASTRART